MRLLGASPPGGHIATVNHELQRELFTHVAFRDCSEILLQVRRMPLSLFPSFIKEVIKAVIILRFESFCPLLTDKDNTVEYSVEIYKAVQTGEKIPGYSST